MKKWGTGIKNGPNKLELEMYGEEEVSILNET